MLKKQLSAQKLVQLLFFALSFTVKVFGVFRKKHMTTKTYRDIIN